MVICLNHPPNLILDSCLPQHGRSHIDLNLRPLSAPENSSLLLLLRYRFYVGNLLLHKQEKIRCNRES
jgi:hypothetical protein